MTLDEMLSALNAIRQEHGGDLLVLHHDEWEHFLVESISVEPESDVPENCIHPKHIRIDGEARCFDCATGALTNPYE